MNPKRKKPRANDIKPICSGVNRARQCAAARLNLKGDNRRDGDGYCVTRFVADVGIVDEDGVDGLADEETDCCLRCCRQSEPLRNAKHGPDETAYAHGDVPTFRWREDPSRE